MLKKHLDKILIISGLVLIAVAIGLRVYSKWQNDKMVAEFEEYVAELNNYQVPSPQPDDIITEPSTEADEVPAPAIPDGILGVLKIPKIDLNVNVCEGTDSETLKYSVGHFTQTAQAGQKGNFALIGHRSYTFGQHFNRLDELEAGDFVSILTPDGEFTYQITEKEVVLPTEMSVLNPTDEATITLITCTPMRSGTHRLIVRGVLLEN